MKVIKRIKEYFFRNERKYAETEIFDWVQVGGDDGAREVAVRTARELSRKLVKNNPNYLGMIRTYVKYLAGRKFSITCDDEDAQKKWDDFAKKYRFSQLFKRLVFAFFQDGEAFIYLPEMILIRPEYVTVLDGSYKLRNGGKEIIIPAEEIQHVKNILFDDERRGECYLSSLQKRVDQLSRWLDSRVLLNEIRSSIALIRKKTVAPRQNKNFSDANVTSTCSPKYTEYGDQRRKIFSPGSVIDATGIDYQFLAPNVDAKDVAEDGRNIGLTFSAMTGLPEFMVRGDSSNSNYASTMISEGPAEKEFEDWQDFFQIEIEKLWESEISMDVMPTIVFPPIMSKNKKEETERNKILLESGVISVEEWRRREQLDSDLMELEINAAF